MALVEPHQRKRLRSPLPYWIINDGDIAFSSHISHRAFHGLPFTSLTTLIKNHHGTGRYSSGVLTYSVHTAAKRNAYAPAYVPASPRRPW